MGGGTIIVDTRQHNGKHEGKHAALESMGFALVSHSLPWGDYAAGYARSIDTKKDIYELAQCIDHDHERFKRELIGARDHGCELTILTINGDGVRDLATLAAWSEPDSHLSMRRNKSKNMNARRIEGKRLAKACATMSARYGAKFEFCADEDEAARRIAEVVGNG